MANNVHTQQMPDRSSTTTTPGDRTTASQCQSGMMGCGMGHKGLKGLLLMAACCGAPLLLFLALPVLGSALGGLGVSVVNTLALLACPVGMGLMMWFMMRAQQAAARQPTQAEPAALSQVSTSAPAEPQDTGAPLSPSAPVAATLTLPSSAPEEEGTSPHSGNGHQTARRTLAANGQPVAVQTPTDGTTLVAPSPRE
jgi:hypothetical protein